MFLGFLFAALLLQTVSATSARADEVGTEYEFYFAGNVKYDSEPLEGVTIFVEGNGYEAEVDTAADGKWKIGVPEKGTYTVTLNEETLPEGVIVAEGSASVEAEIKLTNSKIVNYFLGEGVRETTSFWDQLAERIVNGLNFGLLLALAAVGASLVFGTTGLSNFAHGEMVTFGAVMAYVFANVLQWPLWSALVAAVIVSALFGFTLDTGLWKPLRRKGIGIVQVMIVSIGLSLLIRYVFLYFIGGGTYQLPGAGEARITLFGTVALSVTDMVSMGVSVVVLLAVAWWLLRTRTGKATRAISDNPSLAAASGIDVDKVIRTVWILAAALAGLAGILWAYFRPGIKWDMGTQILLLVFGAIVLGGLGTAFGALIGAIIVGLLVEVSTLWIPSDIKYVGALVVLIGVLLVKPQGLLGRKERIG
ncbi:branched-chain amino acid ABC transporter permease [Mycetocola zhadangensis]|uniref:Branched-chain amino acid ABC transporter permease n=1 Tax=Mycetocola zhadangensis TaxID=1164595 RepID=A0A3L7J7E0_9MICO|nr:branched-chain amino acid ABC transporter permease [Mycetocola zhadangensis]